MTHFRKSQFSIHEENKRSRDETIIKVAERANPSVQDFQIEDIQENGRHDYSAVKAKYGPLAASDPDRVAKSQKDRRFVLNSLLRDPLSVEQEERRAIEESVRDRVSALTDEAKSLGYNEGFKEGLQKGHEEALQRFRVENSPKVEQLDLMIKSAEAAKNEIFKANERFLIELIFSIAKKMILKELNIDKEYLIRLANELIHRVGVRENIKLTIHPDDAEILEALEHGIKQNYSQLENLNIDISNQASRGGCRIESEWNVIDAKIDAQLEAIHDTLIGAGV